VDLHERIHVAGRGWDGKGSEETATTVASALTVMATQVLYTTGTFELLGPGMIENIENEMKSLSMKAGPKEGC